MASINILYERARIMINWDIDISVKEVLHEGFKVAITLNDGTYSPTKTTGKESTCSCGKWGR